LHFAAALGRVKLVKALLRQGANPSITANGGETALMRTVCHVSCYDAQVFDQIADLLRDSVYLADNNRRTVFHHAARAARRRDLWVAAGYYVRILAHVLQEEYSEAPHLVPQVVNTQDTHGNTALHYACRSGNRNLTLTLLRLGANHELLNANGESPVDI
ncbi:ankyrin repeat-containing domain protein, partial [Powellomyces hirtus]